MQAENIQKLLKKLPHSPGVYKMKDDSGRILYVGKAKDLAKRVRSYFVKMKERPKRTEKMLDQVKDLEWIQVESDFEAIVLESNLIKELRPKYNVLLKDDKNFVYIKITKNEDYPQVQVVRKIEKDGARYFGPKSSASSVKKLLILLQKLFPYRSCTLGIQCIKPGEVRITRKNIQTPCLDYHIKRCAGPCIAGISPEQYADSIKRVEQFLEGKTEDIQLELETKMKEFVSKKEFEKAALTRDKYLALKSISEKQMVSSTELIHRDIWNFVFESEIAYFTGFLFRNGKLISQENFQVKAPGFFSGDEEEGHEVLESFLYQFYENASYSPQEILAPLEFENALFEEWFEQIQMRKVHLVFPQKGKKHKLLDLALKNAISFRDQEKTRWEKDHSEALNQLRDVLKLKKNPHRIEGFDISHLGGHQTVASMVVFENGESKNSDYRRFILRKIQSGEIDDFKSMNEIIFRRMSHLSQASGYQLKQVPIEEDLVELHLNHEKKLEFSMKLKKMGSNIYEIQESEKLNLKDPLRIYFYLSIIFSKLKAKRIYLKAEASQRSILETIGFKIIKKSKEELIETEALHMAFDPRKEKDLSMSSKPDLLLIDGGKGQMNAALKAINEFKLSIPLLGLAKREEEIFIPGQSEAIRLDSDSEALKLLQRIRDEAHRFALSFQRERRKKEFFNQLP